MFWWVCGSLVRVFLEGYTILRNPFCFKFHTKRETIPTLAYISVVLLVNTIAGFFEPGVWRAFFYVGNPGFWWIILFFAAWAIPVFASSWRFPVCSLSFLWVDAGDAGGGRDEDPPRDPLPVGRLRQHPPHRAAALGALLRRGLRLRVRARSETRAPSSAP